MKNKNQWSCTLHMVDLPRMPDKPRGMRLFTTAFLCHNLKRLLRTLYRLQEATGLSTF